jgi:hypothetical protein
MVQKTKYLYFFCKLYILLWQREWIYEVTLVQRDGQLQGAEWLDDRAAVLVSAGDPFFWMCLATVPIQAWAVL